MLIRIFNWIRKLIIIQLYFYLILSIFLIIFIIVYIYPFFLGVTILNYYDWDLWSNSFESVFSNSLHTQINYSYMYFWNSQINSQINSIDNILNTLPVTYTTADEIGPLLYTIIVGYSEIAYKCLTLLFYSWNFFALVPINLLYHWFEMLFTFICIPPDLLITAKPDGDYFRTFNAYISFELGCVKTSLFNVT